MAFTSSGTTAVRTIFNTKPSKKVTCRFEMMQAHNDSEKTREKEKKY